MAEKRNAPSSHIPLLILWDHSHNETPLKPDHREHFRHCDICVRVLGMCRMGRSLRHIREMLRDEGFADEFRD